MKLYSPLAVAVALLLNLTQAQAIFAENSRRFRVDPTKEDVRALVEFKADGICSGSFLATDEFAKNPIVLTARHGLPIKYQGDEKKLPEDRPAQPPLTPYDWCKDAEKGGPLGGAIIDAANNSTTRNCIDLDVQDINSDMIVIATDGPKPERAYRLSNFEIPA